MTDIKDLIADDPNIHPAFKRAMGANYRATLGRRREFLSQSDADEYDRGCVAFAGLHRPDPLTGWGPFRDGWCDTWSEAEERATASLEVELDDERGIK